MIASKPSKRRSRFEACWLFLADCLVFQLQLCSQPMC